MLSGKTIKLVLFEVVQFACLSVPLFVIMERFASLMRHVRGGDLTAYWLVVAASIAYVTTVSLLVWVPLKYFILTSRRFISEITAWRPITLAYVIVCPLPCFGILLAGSKVQVDGGHRLDRFTELAVSLVLLSLIILDVVERIRPLRLTGQAEGLELDFELPTPVLTHLEQVTTVSSQVGAERGQNGSPHQTESGNVSSGSHWRDNEGYSSRATRRSYLYSSSSSSRFFSGRLRSICVRDPRVDALVESFLFWMDTTEMVRAAEVSALYYTNWVFPIYILAYLSTLRLVLTPSSPLLPFLGVVLQDLPFLVIRLCLVGVFGYVTPLLYIMKNLFVCLTYVYFIFMTKLKVFNRTSMF
ncbi:transmembrane protein 236 [Alosa pseudoharengus]|uniref:transmembrane protein 236 n=1 Tax=Alosa pseudoharengus TaxID=34774 RepID=UPI003F8B8D88